MNQNSQKELRDPSGIKCKGRPKIGKRIKSSVEMGESSQVKYFYQKVGHYMSTCQFNYVN